jgi:hypothetical protein
MDTRATPMFWTRILVVDDNSTMRETITLLIDGADGSSVCGEAQCISEALEQCVEIDSSEGRGTSVTCCLPDAADVG